MADDYGSDGDASGSGAMDVDGARRRPSAVSDDGSLSSGDSDEFQPPGGNAEASGSGKRVVTDSSDLDELADDAVDEKDDDEDDADELDGEDELGSDDDRRAGAASSSRGATRTGKRGGGGLRARRPPKVGAAPAPTLPTTYDAYVREAIEAFCKVPRVDEKAREVERHLARVKRQDRDMLPPGPPTDYAVRLKRRVMRGPADVVVVDGDAGGDGLDTWEAARKDRMYELTRRHGVASPWEAWEGEGWWPGAKVGKGKAGWKGREELRTGVDGVGRLSAQQLDVLDKAAAQMYLPTSQDSMGRDGVTVHLGPLDSQRPRQIRLFDTVQLHDVNPVHNGFLLGAGGPIWGLDWAPCPDRVSAAHDYAQFLAVSALPSPSTKPTLGSRCAPDMPGALQLWSVLPPTDVGTPDGAARCELVLCVSGGAAVELKWAPTGAWDEPKPGDAALPKLGILAAVQLDGTVKLYAVPHPRAVRAALERTDDEPIFLRSVPLLVLDVADATATCIEWMTGTRLAVGLANVWDVLDALQSSGPGVTAAAPLPSAYMMLAQSAVRSLSTGRLPPAPALAASSAPVPPLLPALAAPPYLVFAALDGSSGLCDLRDASCELFTHSRLPLLATAWSTANRAPLLGDVDYCVSMVRTRTTVGTRLHLVAPHRGPVWSIASSEHHAMLLSGAADGALVLASTCAGLYRRKHTTLAFQRVYEVDYDAVTGEYRVADTYAPETTVLDQAVSRNRGFTKAASGVIRDPDRIRNPHYVKTGSWPVEVAVHRAAWQTGAGIARAGWAASGGFMGVARVEWVEGRWAGGAAPPDVDDDDAGV